MADEKTWQEQEINNRKTEVVENIEITYPHKHHIDKKLKVGDAVNGGVITAIS